MRKLLCIYAASIPFAAASFVMTLLASFVAEGDGSHPIYFGIIISSAIFCCVVVAFLVAVVRGHD